MQARQKALDDGLGLAHGLFLGGVGELDGGRAGLLLARSEEGFDDLLGFVPLAAEGLHYYGIDEDIDIFLAREVRAELGALGGVQATLEQGAEDGGLDRTPIQPGGGGDAGDFIGGQVGDGGAVEQVSVEMQDGFQPEFATFGHRLE